MNYLIGMSLGNLGTTVFSMTKEETNSVTRFFGYVLAAVVGAWWLMGAEQIPFWVSWEDAVGKPKIVFVSATWCGKCPELKKKCQALIERKGWDIVPVLLDSENAVAKKLVGNPNSPMPVIIVIRGDVQRKCVGYDEQVITGYVEQR